MFILTFEVGEDMNWLRKIYEFITQNSKYATIRQLLENILDHTSNIEGAINDAIEQDGLDCNIILYIISDMVDIETIRIKRLKTGVFMRWRYGSSTDFFQIFNRSELIKVAEERREKLRLLAKMIENRT